MLPKKVHQRKITESYIIKCFTCWEISIDIEICLYCTEPCWIFSCQKNNIFITYRSVFWLRTSYFSQLCVLCLSTMCFMMLTPWNDFSHITTNLNKSKGRCILLWIFFCCKRNRLRCRHVFWINSKLYKPFRVGRKLKYNQTRELKKEICTS